MSGPVSYLPVPKLSLLLTVLRGLVRSSCPRLVLARHLHLEIYSCRSDILAGVTDFRKQPQETLATFASASAAAASARSRRLWASSSLLCSAATCSRSFCNSALSAAASRRSDSMVSISCALALCAPPPGDFGCRCRMLLEKLSLMLERDLFRDEAVCEPPRKPRGDDARPGVPGRSERGDGMRKLPFCVRRNSEMATASPL